VSIGTRLRAGWPRVVAQQWKEIFLFSVTSRPVLGLTQAPIKLVPVALSLRVKRPGSEADKSPPSSAAVNNAGAIIPLPHTFSSRDV
jgi:hypothetical protein